MHVLNLYLIEWKQKPKKKKNKNKKNPEKQNRTDLFRDVINKILLQIIYSIYKHKEDLTLNNLQIVDMP